MVRAFCSPLNSFFASIAHYGVVSEKNARCFYANAQMELGAYILVVSSLMLSQLSHFILSAEKQRTEEVMNVQKSKISRAFRCSVLRERECIMERSENVIKLIRPLPIQFTDFYSWLLACTEVEEEIEIDFYHSPRSRKTKSNAEQHACHYYDRENDMTELEIELERERAELDSSSLDHE